MSHIEVRPLGIQCNLQCRYCYQHSQREAGNITRSYDLAQMKKGVERIAGARSTITLFGGEPLLVPEEDLEELFSWGFERFGKNGIQTNGTMLNDNHIRMFRDYKVCVGISVDGPGECNDLRWGGSLENTRTATAKTQAAIERLCAENVPVGLIVTMHRGNSVPEKLPMMHDWFRELEKIGVTNSRLHPLEVEDEEAYSGFMLTEDEAVQAFLSYASLSSELRTLRFDMVDDIRNLLLGRDANMTCCFSACDPYTTSSCHGVEGNGQTSSCGRVNKDGVDHTKAEQAGYERYLALYYVPQDEDGCSGCRFFSMCKGFCPGTAIAGDWRRRTRDCHLLFRLFEYFEGELADAGYLPLSVSPLRTHVEGLLLSNWANGLNSGLLDVMRSVHDKDAVDALREFLEANRVSCTYRDGWISHVDHTDSIDDAIATGRCDAHERRLGLERS